MNTTNYYKSSNYVTSNNYESNYDKSSNYDGFGYHNERSEEKKSLEEYSFQGYESEYSSDSNYGPSSSYNLYERNARYDDEKNSKLNVESNLYAIPSHLTTKRTTGLKWYLS